MASNTINPLEDWESEELSEAELDLLAGGSLLPDFNTSLSNPPGSIPPLTPLDTAASAKFNSQFNSNDIPVLVPKKVDSSYTSYFGAIGTTGNEISAHVTSKPANLTNLFP